MKAKSVGKILLISLLSTFSIFGTIILVYWLSKSLALSLITSILPLYPIVHFLPKIFPSEIADYNQKVENDRKQKLECTSTE
jgi:glycerol-3-phosphate acyltransferase PlsY